MTVPGAGPLRRAGPSAVTVLLFLALVAFSGGCGGDDSAEKEPRDRTERTEEPARTTDQGKGESTERRSPPKGTATSKDSSPAERGRHPRKRGNGKRAGPNPGEPPPEGLGYGKEGPRFTPTR